MPSQPPLIRAIFFDAAGTLIRLREPVGQGYARVARGHGFDLDPATTSAAFRSVWAEMPPLGSPLGRAGDRSEKHWWRTLVEAVMDRVGSVQCADRSAYFEDLFQHYAEPTAWQVYPEVGELLAELASRAIPLFVLSNFDGRILPVLRGLGLAQRFEAICYSAEIGHAKPAREAFSHAVARAGVPAAACLHVGDDPEADWAGARKAGLQVFELNRKLHDLSDLLKRWDLRDFSH